MMREGGPRGQGVAEADMKGPTVASAERWFTPGVHLLNQTLWK